MHASESALDSGTASHSSRHDMLAIISSRYEYGPVFLFSVAEVMSDYLTTDGLKKIFSTSGGPLRPVAFATSATWLIRHWTRHRSLCNNGWARRETDWRHSPTGPILRNFSECTIFRGYPAPPVGSGAKPPWTTILVLFEHLKRLFLALQTNKQVENNIIR